MNRTSLLLVLVACAELPDDGDCPTVLTGTAGDCRLDEDRVSDLMTRFDDGSLVKVNADPFEQVTESTLRNVYISALPVAADLDTVELYKSLDPYTRSALSHPFPVGTVLVHERIDRIEGHTIQVRLGDDYVNEGGGPWWFGKFYDDGTPDEVPCSPCEMCHSTAMYPETEGLWGVPHDAF